MTTGMNGSHGACRFRTTLIAMPYSSPQSLRCQDVDQIAEPGLEAAIPPGARRLAGNKKGWTDSLPPPCLYNQLDIPPLGRPCYCLPAALKSSLSDRERGYNINRFTYIEARTLRQAVDLLKRHGSGARIVAGATDLLIRWRQGVWQPEYLIDIKNVPGLDRVRYSTRGGLRIGALVPIRTLELHPDIRQRYSAMTAAATSFAGVQIRNLATMGGNLCNASPAGDTLPSLLAFGGEARIVGPAGQRWLPLDEFFLGPGRTVLDAGELVAELRFPPVSEHTGSLYIKHSPRKAMDISTVGVASFVSLQPRSGTFRTVRIGMGAVGPTPMRARRAEALLQGQPIDAALIAEAARTAAGEARPIDDIRGPAWHRREVVEVLVRRTLEHALAAALRGAPDSFETIRDLSVEAVA